MNEKKKEPLFHIVKRDAIPWYQSLGIRAAAIVLALILCAIITTVTTGINPIQVYQSIFAGAFGSARKTWITFQNISILLLISLALTPAFKMKFWNIGGEGQVLIGGLASAACMICLGDKLPNAWSWQVSQLVRSGDLFRHFSRQNGIQMRLFPL